MLFKSTGSRDYSAVEISHVRCVPKVLVVKQVGRKNIRVIEKKIGKTGCDNLHANSNKHPRTDKLVSNGNVTFTRYPAPPVGAVKEVRWRVGNFVDPVLPNLR